MPLVGTVVVIAAQQMYGWMGVAVVAGGLLMWLLLHFNRTMAVLRKAADRPIGHVGSAVMLNARLRTGVTLLHVVALTRSLGALQSEQEAQPEVYRWTDAGGSHVTCEFRNGRLVSWVLWRPETTATP
ncbi:hypothetical protein EV674_12412 [Simplicispira metamorpha]|jgi:hypothetical protein|uniref:Glycerate kinase n=2 Tax=Comamonadaceae TaxID=80864 RepID=A0A4R2N4I4_9BURK|nr:hypothetical protein EV674_12412 [Simplicispira metamorpha]